MKPKTLFLCAASALLAGPAVAFNPQPEPPPTSLPFSLGEDEQITVHIVNAVDRMRIYVPPEPVAEQACAVRVSVSDNRGRPVAVVEGRIAPGRTRSMSFEAGRLGIGAGERRTLRVAVDFTGEGDERLRCHATTRASLEVRSGRGAVLGAILEIPTDWVSGIDPNPF